MSRQVEVTDKVSVRAAFSSGQRYGPGVHTVPDDVAEDLLTHRAVITADGSDSGADGSDTVAAAFVDRHHAAVRADIADGEADHMLPAVKQAEQDRTDRDSVIQAIQTRQGEL